MQSGRGRTQPRRHGWFERVLVQFLGLGACEPAEVQRTQIATGQLGAQGQERCHPALSVVIILAILRLGPEAKDDMRGGRPGLQSLLRAV